MMPMGTNNIPMLEPSITTSGNVVALNVVSFAVIVTVINVLEVTLSLAPGLVERKGTVAAEAVVERKLAVVLLVSTAMIGCEVAQLKVVF